MKEILFITLLLAFTTSCSNSQEKTETEKHETNTEVEKKSNHANYSEKDIQIVQQILQKGKTESWFEKELGDIILLVGNELLETKYVAGVLDQNKKEQLIIDIQSLDCVTFVENCSVLSSLIKQKKTDFNDYTIRLMSFRYRDGEIKDYLSRLHYFSDWLFENEKAGNIEQIAKEIANTPKEASVFFISKNADKYPLLATIEIINKFSLIEKEISARDYYYIPENEINKYKKKIPDGTIIGITTSIKGLDITHTGIAIHINGELHLMHASSSSMQVEISEKTLQKMLNDNKIQTGIMLAKVIK